MATGSKRDTAHVVLGGTPSEEYGTVRLWLEYCAGAVLGFLVSRYRGACLKDATTIFHQAQHLADL